MLVEENSVLPEEILLRIFEKSDKSELRRILEVSSGWRQLLIKNARIMRKLPLILMSDTWRDKMKFVEVYGKFIRRVEFIETNFDSRDDVLNILRRTPNVEQVSLIGVQFAETKPEEAPQDKLFLGKLKAIVIEDSAKSGMLDFLAESFEVNLRSLKCDVHDEDQFKILCQLLTESCELKVLKISSNLDATFNPSDDVLEQFKFKLQKLSIGTLLMKHDEQLAKFLSSQQCLEDLKFSAEHVDSRYHQMMFAQLPRLRKVQFNIDSIATSDCLVKLRKIEQNKTIESLSLLGRNNHLNIFDAILEIFPNVSSLTIQNLTQFHSDKIRLLPLTRFRITDCVAREYVTFGCTPTKIQLEEKKLRRIVDKSGGN